jgi:hypothetical protein
MTTTMMMTPFRRADVNIRATTMPTTKSSNCVF